LGGGLGATWKREFKLPWREAGPSNHHDDKVVSDQQVVNKELALSGLDLRFLRVDLDCEGACQLGLVWGLQGYLTYKKPHHLRTLQ